MTLIWTCSPYQLIRPPTHHRPNHPLTRPAQVLGAKRRNLAGFSSTTVQPHQGFIFASDIIQQAPPSLRSKAARLVGAKCTLLARVDAYGQVCWCTAWIGRRSKAVLLLVGSSAPLCLRICSSSHLTSACLPAYCPAQLPHAHTPPPPPSLS